MNNKKNGFDYKSIPLGFYDRIAIRKRGVRSFWHHLKFKRIIDGFEGANNSILDIGCFAGTFLGMIPETMFKEQIGVDILKDQVEYANKNYGNEFRKFCLLEDFKNDKFFSDGSFDVITLIEVIEHLSESQITEIFTLAYNKLKPKGKLIITTPNYLSAWPFLEWILDMVSDVKYEEQHISRFNYLTVSEKLKNIIPEFEQLFCIQYKTTTHLFTPLIAGISFEVADKLSSVVSPAKWKIPLGALLILKLIKQ